MVRNPKFRCGPTGFSEFLIQLCIKSRFLGGPCRNITAMCRKIAFFGLRAEILLARSQGLLDSRAGPFLGSVKKYWFFGEIFTSGAISTRAGK